MVIEKAYLYMILLSAVPSAPTPCGFRAESFTSATLMWTPPTDVPLCVHNYTVHVFTGNSEDEDTHSTANNITSITVTGLNHGVEYSFTVAAQDSAGRSGNISQPRRFTLDGIVRY